MKYSLNRLVFILIFLSGCRRDMLIRRSSTLFGQKAPIHQNVLRIHFDRLGYLYPDEEISNKVIKNNGSTLVGMKIAANQDSIFKKNAERINDILKKKSIDNVTFILVGYNNKYFSSCNSRVGSAAKLPLLQSKIYTFLETKNKQTLVIELHWDTMHQLLPLQIFGIAKENSFYAGLSMRRLINLLDVDKINIISHSLGANVVCEALFNQISELKAQKKATKRIERLVEKEILTKYLEVKYKDILYATTNKEVNAAIVAPAIAGIATFNDYDKRTKNLYDRQHDNYHFTIGFNKNDLILRKILDTPTLFFNRKCGYLTKVAFGSTALGACDDEVNAVKQIFKERYKSENFSVVDFSNKKHRRWHGIRSYLADSQYYIVLEEIFER